jgi:hypothetical protein
VDCLIFKREVRRPQALADLREDDFTFKVWPWQQSTVKGEDTRSAFVLR